MASTQAGFSRRRPSKPARPKLPAQPSSGPPAWLVPAICVALAGAVWIVFGQTRGFDFVNYDDNEYVYGNPIVAQGLTAHGIKWAFTRSHAANWHPLTWISHMVDCQLYGLNAGGHHITNVAIHTVSVILLFLALRRMTGALGRSAFVAALFAIHPLHVESVAWVAERKDVLSGLFFMLTLWAYARYAERPRSLGRYLLVACFTALGLMSKPSLVTLPGVLLLLDYWPLKRANLSSGRRTWSRLVLEKAPLLALAAGSCVVTMLAQSNAEIPVATLPFALRFENVLVTYAAYLGQMIYPAGLAAFYPFPAHGIPAWQVAASLATLAAISALAFTLRRARPYLIVGWLWYLGMLVPMIGLVQVGFQSRADRYTYLSQIGVYVFIAWGVYELWPRAKPSRIMLAGIACALVAGLITLARAQTAYWKNGVTLWTHNLAAAAPSAQAEWIYGKALIDAGRLDDAATVFRTLTEQDPGFVGGFEDLGIVLARQGQTESAINYFRKALEMSPRREQSLNNLGIALSREGKIDEAISDWQTAIEIDPEDASPHYNIGLALAGRGERNGAILEWETALNLNPGMSDAHDALGSALMANGRVDEAIAHWRAALKSDPSNAGAHFNLAQALIQQGDVAGAIDHFEAGLAKRPGDAKAHYDLGLALLKSGEPVQAIDEWQKSLKLSPGNGLPQNQIAWVMSTWPESSIRDGTQALKFATEAARITKQANPQVLDTLAAAQAECGLYIEAAETEQGALDLLTSGTNPDPAAAAQLQDRIKLFKNNLPYHNGQ